MSEYQKALEDAQARVLKAVDLTVERPSERTFLKERILDLRSSAFIAGAASTGAASTGREQASS